MDIPFTEADFLRVIVDYNTAVWPAQFLLAALAILALTLAVADPSSWAQRAVNSILGVLWIWMGIVYHWLYFTAINHVAWVFGGLFVIQGLLFFYLGLRSEPLRYRPQWDGFGLVAVAFLGYALVLYPMLGAAVGHAYPAQPTFGLPCPTTIFTLGILLWAIPRIHPAVLVIPVVWSLIGMNAAWLFGIVEDFGLPVAGIAAAVLIALKNRRPWPTTSPDR